MKLLVFTSRFPYPIEKGDKLRAYHQLRELSRRHEVVLVSLTTVPVTAAEYDQVAAFCARIYLFPQHRLRLGWQVLRAVLRGLPAQVGYFYQPRLHRRIRAIIVEERPDHLYCQLLRMAEYLPDSEVTATLDYMDAFSVGMQRRVQRSWWGWRWLLAVEGRRLARYEADIFPDFAHHTIISEQDRQHLPFAARDRVEVVPNGIDLQFFRREAPAAPRHDLVFVGNMGYFPNVEAARYLLREVMPRVWAQRPETTLLLAGALPSAEVRALGRDARVRVSGWVADIRDAYLDGRLFVAPLFTGSGQQNKILEAMALGLPCLTTSLVNNAIGAQAPTQIHVADDAEAFATQILEGLAHPRALQAVATAGEAFVRDQFSWTRSVRQLEDLMARPTI